MRRCGIIILAAGGSTRMGRPKQSLTFNGDTLLHRAVHTAVTSQCHPVAVVLGADADSLAETLHDQPVKLIVNANWRRGIGTSIRAGIAGLYSAHFDAVLIFLCDQPLITNVALDRMLGQHFQQNARITAARYAGSVGTPVIFAHSLFPELLALPDDQGGKAILRRHPDQVQPFDLPEAHLDIDTPAEFDRLVLRQSD